MSLSLLLTSINLANISPSWKLPQGIDYALLALSIVFALCFGIFTIVFFIHRRLLSTEYGLKERFNHILQFLAVSNFKYLEKLAKSNPNLQSLMDQINEGKKIFNDQLQIVKRKLISLTIINSKYSYKKAWDLSKIIKNDLVKCEKMQESLRNIHSSATEYSKNISDLLVEYREITDDISTFYNLNLAFRYPNDDLKNINTQIKNIIAEASGCIIKFDNDKLLMLLNKIDNLVFSSYRISITLYTLDRVVMYAESIKKRIDSQMSAAEKILSGSDFNNVETLYATGKSNLSSFKTFLQKLDFTHAKNHAIIAVKNLGDAMLKIEAGDKTNVLIQKDMKILKDQVNILIKEFNDANNAFKSIQNHFSNVTDISISNKITKLNADIRSIVVFYKNIENEYSNYHLIQRADFLKKINELGKNIIDWKLLLNNFINEVNTKYKNAILINDELADINLTLSQLLAIKLLNKDNDPDGINTIKNIIEHIKQLQQQLATNYSQSYELVNEELTKIREQTMLLITSVSYNQTLKIYAQRMLYYVNKYRNEHEDISKQLQIAETSYKNGKYKDVLDQMIEVITVILSNGRSNNIIAS